VRFGGSIITALKELAPSLKIQERHTEGSVDNAFLLSRGEADYAIVQGDVAAAAVNGDDVFSRGQPLSTLRAVGGLFPEAIHIVVRPDSPIRDVAALRGRRVDIGTPSSGTRFDAVAVLAAYGKPTTSARRGGRKGASAGCARADRRVVHHRRGAGTWPRRGRPGRWPAAADHDAALEQPGQARPGLVRLALPLTIPASRAPSSPRRRPHPAHHHRGSPSRSRTVVDPCSRMAKGRGGAGRQVSAANQLRGVTIPLHGHRPHDVRANGDSIPNGGPRKKTAVIVIAARRSCSVLPTQSGDFRERQTIKATVKGWTRRVAPSNSHGSWGDAHRTPARM
jgi:hypothetical protein